MRVDKCNTDDPIVPPSSAGVGHFIRMSRSACQSFDISGALGSCSIWSLVGSRTTASIRVGGTALSLYGPPRDQGQRREQNRWAPSCHPQWLASPLVTMAVTVGRGGSCALPPALRAYLHLLDARPRPPHRACCRRNDLSGLVTMYSRKRCSSTSSRTTRSKYPRCHRTP
jgi:hypothetical protein